MVTPSATNIPETATTDLPSGPPATPRDIPFLQDPTVDHLLRAVITLTMELSVTRERLRSIELIMAGDGRDISAEIDRLSISHTEDTARRADREKIIGSILRPFLSPDTGDKPC